MSTEPPPITDVMEERRRLLSLAYRMMGTLSEAEDVVQETYLRWYRQSEEDRAAIRNPAAWLTRVASRVALDGTFFSYRAPYQALPLPQQILRWKLSFA